jgi:hypothetical protein
MPVFFIAGLDILFRVQWNCRTQPLSLPATMKRLISIFLLLTLATQMLPIQQIGNILCSNQLNEELPHSVDTGKTGPLKADFKNDYLSPFIFSMPDLISSSELRLPERSASIPQQPAVEIMVPPPNAVS